MKKKRLNILYLITDLNIGGTEKMLLETVKRIDKDSYCPFVVGMKKWGLCAEKIKGEGIHVHVMDIFRYGKLLMPLMLVRAVLKIMEVIGKNDIKILHTFLFQANIAGRIVSIFRKLPAVISSIRVMEKQKTWQLYFDRLTSGLCTKVIVNSNALRKFLVEKGIYSPDKITVIYNGIDSADMPTVEKQNKLRELGCGTADLLIGTAGRLHEQKGIRYLIEAAKIVCNSSRAGNKAVKFIIIGDGPQMNILKNMADGLGLAEKTIFTGWRQDALEIMSIMDIFVLPSLWEGTPNAVLESMACGKPVIMTSVGAADEMIDNNIDGILVKPGVPSEIAEKILWLLENREKAAEIGRNGRNKVKRLFDINEMVRKTEAFYGALNI